MKFHRLFLSLLLLPISIAVLAQSHEHAQSSPAAASAAQQPSAADQSFTRLKTLAGIWEGKVTTVPVLPQFTGGRTQISLRVTSRGNALVHEMKDPDKPEDPTRYDHPVTMLYLDQDQLQLIHYCDAGNRPHMTGKVSPDGKTVEFDFADLSGSNRFGHMHHAVFTFIDADHHIEDWTYMMPGDKPVRAHFELQRVKEGGAAGK